MDDTTRTLALTREERLALANLDRQVRDPDGSNDAEHDAAFDLVSLLAKSLAPPSPDIYGVTWHYLDYPSLCVICGQPKQEDCDHTRFLDLPPSRKRHEREPKKKTRG